MNSITSELEQRLHGIVDRVNGYHHVWFKNPLLDRKNPYVHLASLCADLGFARKRYGPPPFAPSRSIRQEIIDRMARAEKGYVPMMVTSCDYPFLKNLSRAVIAVACCMEVGISALPLLLEAIALYDIRIEEVIALAERYVEIAYPVTENLDFMERIQPLLLDCLQRN